MKKSAKMQNEYFTKILEFFDKKGSSDDAWTSFICTEFTCLCPKTQQPDFAKIFINYIADLKMLESKSAKLYLFSFRNHQDFHENCIQRICDDLVNLLQPKYLEVIGEFTPRGGISIFPYSQYAMKDTRYHTLKQERQSLYSPGQYTCSLSTLYS